MLTLKAFKYRLYPTKKQVEKLQWTLDRCRELCNAALQERRDAWRMCQIGISYNQQAVQLPEIKEIRPEYTEIHSQVLQDVLRRVQKGFDAFFQRIKQGKKAGYPHGASAKADLNKSIHDAGWNQFVMYCTYKAAWAGGRIVTVDPRYTSQ